MQKKAAETQKMKILLLFIASLLFLSFVYHPVNAAAPVCGYKVIEEFPHDSGAFTQGLYWDETDNYIYEGFFLQNNVIL